MDYDLQARSITAAATIPSEAMKVTNLDKLFNLSKRWTREFKAEYAKQQEILIKHERQRIKSNQSRHTQDEILEHLQNVQNDLVSSEPHYEVHSVLCAAMLDPSRLVAWKSELEQVV